MIQSYQPSETPHETYAAWMVAADPMPVIEDMSERMGLGSLPNLFQAVAAMQTEALRIAVHAPFLPFRIYSEMLDIQTPMTEIMDSAEQVVTHIVDTMNHNSEILQQETEKLVETSLPQKSASPKAKTASGPTAGSGT